MGNKPSDRNMSSFGQLDPVVIEPKGDHAASVVFLHGLGDQGHGWHEAFREASLPHVRYVFPHAPATPVSLNGGMRMPSWFDIFGLSPDSPQDEAGIRRASEYLHTLVEKERSAGVPVLVGGFSQGGAVALFYSLTKTNVHGCLALSTWLPLHQQILQEKVAPDTMHIFQAHGSMDPVVPYQWGKSTHEMLKQFYKSAEFKTYNMMHSSHPQEMADAKEFLSKIVPPK